MVYYILSLTFSHDNRVCIHDASCEVQYVHSEAENKKGEKSIKYSTCHLLKEKRQLPLMNMEAIDHRYMYSYIKHN